MIRQIVIGISLGLAVIVGISQLPHHEVRMKTAGDFYDHYCQARADIDNCLAGAQEAWNDYNKDRR